MYIGVDLGTSSVKCILVDDSKQIIKTVSKDYELLMPKSNWTEQHPEDWAFQTTKALKELLSEESGKVKGISFSGQMHGLVILDEYDNVIRPAILWNDQRTVEQCEYLNNVIGKDKISSYTANIALTGFTAPKILWVKDNEPENFQKIRKIMLPKDYIAYCLSGTFATDMSDASGTLYLDVKNRTWSKEMLEILNITENQLPKLYESYEIIGEVLKDVYLNIPQLEGTKVIIGGGDQAMGAIGVGSIGNGDCSIALGTSGVIFVSSDEFVADKNNALHSFAHANGKYHSMGVMLSSAGSVNWYVEQLLQRRDYDVLTDLAKELPVDGDLFFLPYLVGERTPINDPNAKGVMFGLSLSDRPEHLFKAVLEGVTFTFRDTFEIIKGEGVKVDKVRAIGGGANNQYWLQLIADILNVDVELINTNEGGALGAVILSAFGTGEYNSIEEACSNFIKPTKVITPRPNIVKEYDKKYAKFSKIYPTIKGLY